MAQREVVILSGVRTPIGDYGGSLKDFAPTDLAARVVREAVSRAKVDPKDIAQCVFGNVIHTEPKDMYLSRVAALKRGIEREPYATVKAFWRSCGAPDFAPVEALDVPRLHEGLDWLMQWDVRDAKDGLARPMLALAARDDAVVPAAMSEAIWRKPGLVWSPDGGHVLPLRHPQWCARHVLEFARSLPA